MFWFLYYFDWLIDFDFYLFWFIYFDLFIFSDSGQVDEVMSRGFAAAELKTFMESVEVRHNKMKELENQVIINYYQHYF